MKVARRRTRLSKLASKVQDRAKRATVGTVNRHNIKSAGLKNNKTFQSQKKVRFKPRFASTTRKIGRVGKSYGKGQVVARPVKKTSFERNRIVRIMGHGQFTVNRKVLAKLSKVDCAMVGIVSNDRPNDDEFRKRLAQLTDIVRKFGKPYNSKEIVRSDIILPSVDLSIDEAKKLFKGEGVIPVT